MPEISEQDFAALAAQVASLSSALAVARRRIDDLEEGMTDHLGLDWGESLVDVNSPHPNISASTVESGGGRIRLSSGEGIQIVVPAATGESNTQTIWFVTELSNNPSSYDDYNSITGYIDPGYDSGLTLESGSQGGNSSVFLYGDVAGESMISLRVDDNANLNVGAETVSINAELSVNNSANVQSGSLIASSVASPSQITSNQNNYNPWSGNGQMVFRLTSDASRDITGLLAFLDNYVVFLFNVGSFDIVLKDEDAGSTAANRFALQADITVPPDGAAILWYDSASSRWRCVGTY